MRTNSTSSGSSRGSTACGYGVSRQVTTAPARSSSATASRPNDGRDHRVLRAVRDPDRQAGGERRIEREPRSDRDEAGHRDDRRRCRPRRAQTERVAHHRALREAPEHDPVAVERQRVEERGADLAAPRRRSAAPAWGCPPSAYQCLPPGGSESGASGVRPSSRRSGSSSSSSGYRSCTPAPRPWSRTSAPTGVTGCRPLERAGAVSSARRPRRARIRERGQHRLDSRAADARRPVAGSGTLRGAPGPRRPRTPGRASRARTTRPTARGSRSTGTRSGR